MEPEGNSPGKACQRVDVGAVQDVWYGLIYLVSIYTQFLTRDYIYNFLMEILLVHSFYPAFIFTKLLMVFIQVYTPFLSRCPIHIILDIQVFTPFIYIELLLLYILCFTGFIYINLLILFIQVFILLSYTKKLFLYIHVFSDFIYINLFILTVELNICCMEEMSDYVMPSIMIGS